MWEATVNNEGGHDMSDKNKALAARIPLEAFNQGKLEVIDEVIADNSIDHGELPSGMPPGKEGVKLLVKALRSAFPDFKITIGLQVAEGDLVVQQATTTGTMKGEFAGMPPSGKTATWEAIHITRIKDGKIVEHWQVQDQLGMLQQLGFIPTPQAAPAR
ncbi:MAG: ester cyclase [Chloroflexi bacterium]|nr:MAG: ester cyclase [Chloroflexota bacterium]